MRAGQEDELVQERAPGSQEVSSVSESISPKGGRHRRGHSDFCHPLVEHHLTSPELQGCAGWERPQDSEDTLTRRGLTGGGGIPDGLP